MHMDDRPWPIGYQGAPTRVPLCEIKTGSQHSHAKLPATPGYTPYVRSMRLTCSLSHTRGMMRYIRRDLSLAFINIPTTHSNLQSKVRVFSQILTPYDNTQYRSNRMNFKTSALLTAALVAATVQAQGCDRGQIRFGNIFNVGNTVSSHEYNIWTSSGLIFSIAWCDSQWL